MMPRRSVLRDTIRRDRVQRDVISRDMIRRDQQTSVTTSRFTMSRFTMSRFFRSRLTTSRPLEASRERPEYRVAVAPRDFLRDVARQFGQPRSRETRVLHDVAPALRRGSISANHEAVRHFEKQRAPFRVELPRRGMVRAPRKVAPKVLEAVQHLAHFLGWRESGMRPQHARVGILPEHALHGVRVGVYM